MKSLNSFRRAAWSLMFAAASAVGLARAHADDAKPAPAEPPKPAEAPTAPVAPTAPSDGTEVIETITLAQNKGYQLGLSVVRVPEALNSQLDLKGQGALVIRVQDDGPAAKAGVLENDVVLAIGDQQIAAPEDLRASAGKSEGKELTIKLLRGGKEQTLQIKAELRDRPSYTFSTKKHQIEFDTQMIEEKVRQKLKDAGVDLRMQVIQPGAFLPKGANFLINMRAELPDDVTVDIHRQGKQPAEIKVKQGDKSWEVKEGDLSALPDALRPHVERMLGNAPMQFKIAGVDVPFPPVAPKISVAPKAPVAPKAVVTPANPRDAAEKAARAARRGESLERRVEQMNRRLEEMHKHVEALREELKDREDGDRDKEEDVEIEVQDDVREDVDLEIKVEQAK